MTVEKSAFAQSVHGTGDVVFAISTESIAILLCGAAYVSHMSRRGCSVRLFYGN